MHCVLLEIPNPKKNGLRVNSKFWAHADCTPVRPTYICHHCDSEIDERKSVGTIDIFRHTFCGGVSIFNSSLSFFQLSQRCVTTWPGSGASCNNGTLAFDIN